MGNRCPDCNKFTGLENGEPEINEITAEWNSGEFQINGSVRLTRNCEECSGEMKEHEYELSGELSLSDFEGFNELSSEEKESIETRLNTGEIEVDCEDDGADADESGGGRYAKNVITLTAHAVVSFEYAEGKTLSHTIDLTADAAASEFDDLN